MTYEYFLSKFKVLKSALGLGINNAILHRKLWSNSPKGEGKMGFPTHVQSSQICKKSMGTHIIPHGILLLMVISSANCL